MNARQLKMVALCWLRFQKGFPFIATEVGYYSSDVLGANHKHLFEVEVKVNNRDFLADFSKPKHETYANYESAHKNYRHFIPNKFYFAVPESMVEFALDKLQRDYDNYGLLTVKWSKWWHKPEIKIVKNAKFLHKEEPTPKTISRIIHRMSSEVIGHVIRLEEQDRAHADMTSLVKKLIRIERKRKVSGRFNTNNETKVP